MKRHNNTTISSDPLRMIKYLCEDVVFLGDPYAVNGPGVVGPRRGGRLFQQRRPDGVGLGARFSSLGRPRPHRGHEERQYKPPPSTPRESEHP